MSWVVAYDVRQNRSRSRVARRLERAGLRVQKSVFVVALSAAEVRQLVEELGRLVDARTDQVAAWPLEGQCSGRCFQAGRASNPLVQTAVVW